MSAGVSTLMCFKQMNTENDSVTDSQVANMVLHKSCFTSTREKASVMRNLFCSKTAVRKREIVF